ncbi:MAG: ABC transporter ATP-binding protein [Candidatus Cloacimonetes bacterium]|nr:ABC transporter ATP-binding protein [Candidatus Cloacimonadota bacterium]
MLEVKNLCKSYLESKEKLEILKGVDLKVMKGETLAISGESGSGKSTLLHLLGMLDSADSGEILYSGKKITIKDRGINNFRNQKIGFVFQFHYLLEDFTAIENVAMPMFVRTGNYQKSVSRAGELLQMLDLYARRKHYPNQLSGGEQQRIAVARALINDPELVLADEPTGNLDENHSIELISYIQELNRSRQQTFIIVTHNKTIANQMDRHLFLSEGVLKPFSD